MISTSDIHDLLDQGALSFGILLGALLILSANLLHLLCREEDSAFLRGQLDIATLVVYSFRILCE